MSYARCMTSVAGTHGHGEYRLRHSALDRQRLDHAMKERLSRADHRLGLAIRTLNTVSPLATLGRGFALVKRVSDGAAGH